MQTEYRLMVNLTFLNLEDRDDWYNTVKNALINLKLSKPLPKKASITRDEYFIQEQSVTESI